LSDVFELSEYEFDVLYGGMDNVKSKNILSDFNVAAYPHMEAKSRQKLHRDTWKVAFPLEFKKSIVTTKQLGAAGIEVGNISDFVKE